MSAHADSKSLRVTPVIKRTGPGDVKRRGCRRQVIDEAHDVVEREVACYVLNQGDCSSDGP